MNIDTVLTEWKLRKVVVKTKVAWYTIVSLSRATGILHHNVDRIINAQHLESNKRFMFSQILWNRKTAHKQHRKFKYCP